LGRRHYHPATFSDGILEFVTKKHLIPLGLILDPFAGVGRIHELRHELRSTVGVEIEKPWADTRRGTIVGNARSLPFSNDRFDGVFTSPCYGNRMADHHVAKDGSTRRSYTHDLQKTVNDPTRQLHPDNAGKLYAWQPEYWELHEAAWREVYRVLKPSTPDKTYPFVLNVSDCIRRKKVFPVVAKHRELCQGLGFMVLQHHEIPTPRLRHGQNHEARVPTEAVIVFKKCS
jgi:tRNA G10  N-methylase Trm11